jgi:hypothetical protein
MGGCRTASSPRMYGNYLAPECEVNYALPREHEDASGWEPTFIKGCSADDGQGTNGAPATE